MASGFEKSLYIFILACSLPAKRILNYVYKRKTNRYMNPWRVEIYIDIGIFICIVMWVTVIQLDKYKTPDSIIDQLPDV